jgi:hypothetical protein
MVAEEYNDPAGVYKVQTFGTLQDRPIPPHHKGWGGIGQRVEAIHPHTKHIRKEPKPGVSVSLRR